MSLLAIPALFRAPSDQLLLTEWRSLRSRGRAYAQPLALVSASCYLLTAYITHSDIVPSRTYKLVAAGLTTLSIIPFRFLGMYGANVELMAREERSWDAAGKGREDEADKIAHGEGKGKQWGHTVDVIRWWGRMNLLRAALPFLGGLIAFDAL